MSKPIHIRATDPDEGLTQANIKHVVYRAHALDKDEVVGRILQAQGRGKTVIFTRTKRAAAKLVEELNDRGYNAAAVHGDLNQEQRERAMAAFKAGKKDILIATDVAARGIDVNDVTHVINHTVPRRPRHLLAPRRPHGSRGQDGHRRDVRRLGRHAQVGAHQPSARDEPARASRDVFLVTAPLQRPRHSRGFEGSLDSRPRFPRSSVRHRTRRANAAAPAARARAARAPADRAQAAATPAARTRTTIPRANRAPKAQALRVAVAGAARGARREHQEPTAEPARANHSREYSLSAPH